jgi:MFS family permease
MTARTEPWWLVGGSVGVALASLGVGFAPAFPFALMSLLVMGACDGLTIVSENGIMQRRTPDAVRSRTMAASESVIAFGLVVAYLMAGPVLNAVGPAGVYRVAGLAAVGAGVVLLPLLRLRPVGAPAAATDVAIGTEVVLAPERAP